MVIIGGGRIGTALQRRAAARGDACVVLGRDDDAGEAWDEPGPLLVCTRNDDLDAVLARTPPGRRGDLFFLQNGMLRPWLSRHGLGANGRGLLFVAVARKGDDALPGGTSPLCGRHGETVAAWLRGLDLPAVAVDPSAFAVVELEKLVWNSAFGLLCQALDVDVGAALADARCDRLLRELIDVGARGMDLAIDETAMIARLRAYAATIPRYRGAVREWPWRNGYFVRAAAEQGCALPVHSALAAQARVEAAF